MRPPAVPRTLRPGPFEGALVLPGAGADVWQLSIAEYGDGTADGSLDLLDATERQRHTDFRRDVDKARYAAAHIGLRHLLGAYLGRAPGDIVLGREPCPLCPEPHGRPCVPGADLHFSLSHSGDLVLLAFAPTAVGVDVELLTDTGQADEVSGVLNPRERAELAALATDDAARLTAFGRCWCRKEAYLKGTGTGLAVPLDATYVGAGPRPGDIPGWLLTDIEVRDGYAAALATANPEPRHGT
ncbi:4'-phosphopantetheinyl transferase family protein [Streptomyces sp. NPDC004111]|uniref:4'-phosphopantetheinyl transferase family protein n=1 Tax=Streptomyces sp. NPDC004111 TaxID=3364690 RepID=UPI0036A1DE04